MIRSHRFFIAASLAVVVAFSASAQAQYDKLKPTTYKKYSPAITVNVVKAIDPTDKYPEGQSETDNIWTRLYRDKLGININILWSVASSQYQNKMAISIASGELPDLVVPKNGLLQNTLIKQNMLEDLTGIWDRNASELTKSLVNDDDGYAMAANKYKGKLYAFPSYEGYVENAHMLWIRADWLKNVGLKKPETWSDVETIMDAFVNKDPDQNGKKDTAALIINSSLYATAGIDGLFAAFHTYPKGLFWLPDGKGGLMHYAIAPQTKAALAKLQEY